MKKWNGMEWNGMEWNANGLERVSERRAVLFWRKATENAIFGTSSYWPVQFAAWRVPFFTFWRALGEISGSVSSSPHGEGCRYPKRFRAVSFFSSERHTKQPESNLKLVSLSLIHI